MKITHYETPLGLLCQSDAREKKTTIPALVVCPKCRNKLGLPPLDVDLLKRPENRKGAA